MRDVVTRFLRVRKGQLRGAFWEKLFDKQSCSGMPEDCFGAKWKFAIVLMMDQVLTSSAPEFFSPAEMRKAIPDEPQRSI